MNIQCGPDELERRTESDVAQGAVYTTLIRLEKKGFVQSRLSDPTPVRGGKAKRMFRITAAGRAGVREVRRTMDRLWEGLPTPESPSGGSA